LELEGTTYREPPYTLTADLQVSPRTETDRNGLIGLRDAIPIDDAVMIVAKDRSGAIVARKAVQLRANWITTLGLWPLSRDD
jgi:hypothetical protein